MVEGARIGNSLVDPGFEVGVEPVVDFYRVFLELFVVVVRQSLGELGFFGAVKVVLVTLLEFA